MYSAGAAVAGATAAGFALGLTWAPAPETWPHRVHRGANRVPRRRDGLRRRLWHWLRRRGAASVAPRSPVAVAPR